MYAHNNSFLNFYEILQAHINNEIYACCSHGQLVVRGILSYVDLDKVILDTETGEYYIFLDNLLYIITLQENNIIPDIQPNLFTDVNSHFYNFINKNVICLILHGTFAFNGNLIYIGNDYITIHNTSDSTVAHIPIANVKNIATCWSNLKKLNF